MAKRKTEKKARNQYPNPPAVEDLEARIVIHGMEWEEKERGTRKRKEKEELTTKKRKEERESQKKERKGVKRGE